MRLAGDTRLALLKAAAELHTPERAPTLRELAIKACVGQEAAMHTVKNLTRCGALKIARTRRVEYRNRPVAEYAPAQPLEQGGAMADLGNVFASWAR
jgi:hypothetical protein